MPWKMVVAQQLASALSYLVCGPEGILVSEMVVGALGIRKGGHTNQSYES